MRCRETKMVERKDTASMLFSFQQSMFLIFVRLNLALLAGNSSLSTLLGQKDDHVPSFACRWIFEMCRDHILGACYNPY